MTDDLAAPARARWPLDPERRESARRGGEGVSSRIAVIGGGAWGTALAQVAAKAGRDVLLWATRGRRRRGGQRRPRKPAVPAGASRSTRRSGRPAISMTIGNCDAWLVVTPAQHMRSVLERAPRCDIPRMLCSKGIEERSGLLAPRGCRRAPVPARPVAVLSGPTFAHEVARGLPTAVTLAAEDADVAKRLRDLLAQPAFRIYLSDDVAGAEIGGAVKNVLAIACGVVEGRGLGQNARAALIARGFAEMTRFGVAMGARPETLAGLSGLGDLVLTCSSTSSRNYSLGLGIGEGRSASELMGDRRTVAEGAFTAPVLARVATSAGSKCRSSMPSPGCSQGAQRRIRSSKSCCRAPRSPRASRNRSRFPSFSQSPKRVGIGPVFLAGGSGRRPRPAPARAPAGDLRQMLGRVEMLGPFHVRKMSLG